MGRVGYGSDDTGKKEECSLRFRGETISNVTIDMKTCCRVEGRGLKDIEAHKLCDRDPEVS